MIQDIDPRCKKSKYKVSLKIVLAIDYLTYNCMQKNKGYIYIFDLIRPVRIENLERKIMKHI